MKYALSAAAHVALFSNLCAAPWDAADLTPVTFKQAPRHAAVTLVEDGKSEAKIVVMPGAVGAEELQKYIQQATGVMLPIVAGTVSAPAIVLGDCPEAVAQGLNGTAMAPEAFAIKTAADQVFIVGNKTGDANGQLWGVYEFLERYVGMRWYFPQAVEDGPEIGQSIPPSRNLVIPPVWLEDAPVTRIRELWPPVSKPWTGDGIRLFRIQTFLRGSSSWPHRLLVHQPNWGGYEDLKKNHPEVFQMRQDGQRQFEVLCYGNPKTVDVYLEGIQNSLSGVEPRYAPIRDQAITVSPYDIELSCYCDECRKLWDDRGGQYGAASKVMCAFVEKLAIEVKRRWPNENLTIVYLPYLNYTSAPAGYKFPGNVEVQIAGMPGLANYKESAIREAEQANIDRWIETSGRKVQHWHYDVWPAHKTKAAYQYPHVIKDFYQRNRDKMIGTFVNGDFNHWPRQHISLYCWQKVMWNPEFDVDAAMDEFCARMFGPASATMRQLLKIQTDGWETSKWPGGRFSPKAVYEVSFPPVVVGEMKKLLDQARQQAQGDSLVSARLDYYATPLEDFFKESAQLNGQGFKPLLVQKVGDDLKLDGKLDDPQWERSTANTFVTATGANQGKPSRYSTTVQAVWTDNGVIFGFKLAEPTPELLETANGGHDNGTLWWDDNVELIFDVTGKNEGEFYQFIVNPDINYWDSKLKDTTWECKGFQGAAHRGSDFWSVEIYLPFIAFPEANKPGSARPASWAGNFTRHRVADNGLKSTKPKQPNSEREYQRMNTTGATTSDNTADFAEIRFVE